MMHAPDIGKSKITLDDKSVELVKVHKADSPNYVFVDINIKESKEAGDVNFKIEFENGSHSNLSYELNERDWNPDDAVGFNTSDVMYLITPDRFANGNEENDVIDGMREGLNREAPYGRHGGDIQGIIDQLDYIDDMGFTAIWLNPVLENDQDSWSYHGYSTTDFYKVDPRFGTNEEYLNLSKLAAERGIGIVMDIIVNHCGHQHWWADDLPFEDWYNQLDTSLVITNHRKETLLDPYASKYDRDQMVQGWFVETMPDLNQRNPFMSKYLIQNSIWWIEYAKLYGIRQDTYSYPYREFMTDWTCAIMNEYPNFNIVGEEWINDPAVIAYWQQDKYNKDGYSSCLRSLMDFPLTFNLHKALNEEEGWSTGLIKLYQSLSKDFHYANANELVIFPDNHDMSRILTQLGGDYDKYKMAIAYILTTRGVPQLFYGTEVLMDNPGTDSHGIIRSDFPGGWVGDSINVFKEINMTEGQKEAQAFCKNLLNWRKDKSVIHNGQFKHFTPENGLYVYFRYDENETVMVVLNKNDERQHLDISRFAEMNIEDKAFFNVINKHRIATAELLSVEANSAAIFEIH